MLKIQNNAALVENFIDDYTDDIVNKLTTKIRSEERRVGKEC